MFVLLRGLLERLQLLWSEKGFGLAGVAPCEGIELCLLVVGEVRNLGKCGALELSLLVGFPRGAVACKRLAGVNLVGAGSSLRLFHQSVLLDHGLVIIDEGDLVAIEPTGFGADHAFDASNFELTSPKAELRECDAGDLFLFSWRLVSFERNFLGFRENGGHPSGDFLARVNATLTGDDVGTGAINESNHGIIPGGLFVFFEQFSFFSTDIVAHDEGNEVCFERLDDGGIAKNFGPEVAAGASSRDFLEEKKNGFASFGREGESSIVVGLPVNFAELHGIVLGGGDAGDEQRTSD